MKKEYSENNFDDFYEDDEDFEELDNDRDRDKDD